MAGISDKPMRQICRAFGAAWTVGEMISGDPAVRHTRKTQQRTDIAGEAAPVVMQIAGTDPQKIAAAAHHHAALGADIIDINMGCPMKKVCRVAAGSALMRDEGLVREILQAAVGAAGVPVTLKTRLGWDDEHLNVPNIAKIAEAAGVAAIAVHGRSRTQMYRGQARYGLIRTVKEQTSLPVWANGDIDSPQKAAQVLEQTGADGAMIGRAAQGQPWLFAEIRAFLDSGSLKTTAFTEKAAAVLQHLRAIHAFYGGIYAVRTARKHLHAYNARLLNDEKFRFNINQIDNPESQYAATEEYLAQCAKILD